MKRAALNINYDSLRTIMNFKAPGASYAEDPCYYVILDRFINLANDYGIHFSMYVVGQDLEDTRVAGRIRMAENAGHEVGNHTYSHLNDLGNLPLEQMRSEVQNAHGAITAALGGHPPCGFIAPGWSTSARLVSLLIDLGYRYDTSLFPSFLMPLIQLKLKLGSQPEYRRRFRVLRRDLGGNLGGSSDPFWATAEHPWRCSSPRSAATRRMMCLPLPTLSGRIPFWHSWAFAVSASRYEHWLREAIRRHDYFYLLTHPADLFDPEKDLGNFPRSVLTFERMAVPLKQKTELLRRALDIICSECQVMTMRELAQHAERAVP